MTRGLRVLGVAVPLLLVLACAAIWNAAFRAPPIHRLALPDGLIALESAAGQRPLGESDFNADYEILSHHFEPQSRPAFCGVASAVAVLNALRGPHARLTQSSFFTDTTDSVRSSLRITFGGMTLEQLAELLRAHGAEATVFHAADADLVTFRRIARENLQTAGDFLLINYQRAVLGQGESGHISPVAAYDARTDRLLVLDVAAYKYPPVWVSAEALWNAMNTVDPASERSRGFVVVREPRPVSSGADASPRIPADVARARRRA
ncbi:MAG: phytochelatin synthase family protein [Sinimarinibacterium sp.]|jgi:hypothetical protein